MTIEFSLLCRMSLAGTLMRQHAMLCIKCLHDVEDLMILIEVEVSLDIELTDRALTRGPMDLSRVVFAHCVPTTGCHW